MTINNDISKSSYMKYLLFANLYFIQGIILTIGWVIIPIYFVEKGISLPITTMVVGIVMIPWSIKFVWGGIVDYFIRFGRKTFIILGGILFAFGLLTVAFIDPSVALIPFAFFLFLSVSGVVFLDVAVDALAIETSHKDERGKISGAMFTGQYSGMAISSFLFAYIAQNIGYSYVFIVAGILILITLLFPFFTRDIKTTKRPEKMRNLLISEFRKKTTLLVSVFSPILLINSGLLRLVIPLYMKIVLELDVAQIGLIIAITPVMTAVGSLLGGPLSDKIGKKIILYVIIGGSIFFSASLIFSNTWQILVFLYGIIEFLRGGYTAVVVAMYMDVSNPRVGATQFSIFTSLANGGTTVGNTVSGSMVAFLGFSRVFLYSAWFFGPALLLLYFIKLKKHTKQRQK